ncbi:MAG: thiolase family protein [Thermoleophilia bacterium]
MSPSAVILGGARTPFGRLGGVLAALTPPELGGVAIRAALRRSGVADDDVDHASHPIGVSGARILLTLVLELRRRGGRIVVAAICSGTAQGDAVVVEV